MKRLFFVILVLALAWSGYWFVGAYAARTAFADWFEARRAQGWQADYSDLALLGFPNRFDATFSYIQLADPDTGWAWEAPFFQVLALSYKPNHVIAVWPDRQDLLLGGLPLTVDSADMRASAVVAGTDLALDHVTFVAQQVRLTPPDGIGIELGEMRVATRRATAAGVENGHDLGLALFRLLPDPALRDALDPGRALPDTVDWLRLDATLGFDRPIDRHMAATGAAPRPTAVELREASLRWGPMALEGKGRLAPDAAGLLEGRIDFVARDWRPLVGFAAMAGLVRPELAPTFQAALDQIDAADGDPDALRVALTWKNGRTSLGPIPLGPAPRF